MQEGAAEGVKAERKGFSVVAAVIFSCQQITGWRLACVDGSFCSQQRDPNCL